MSTRPGTVCLSILNEHSISNRHCNYMDSQIVTFIHIIDEEGLQLFDLLMLFSGGEDLPLL